MDREQEEMQFLGLFGIYKEAYKVILTWRKIFSQITLALILPLSFIYLAQLEVSHLLLAKINRNARQLDRTQAGTPKYDKLADVLSDEWTYYLLFRAIYFTFYVTLSLISTAAVVYTIACIYTARDLSFGKVMSVVPKVWKRLMVTFLCIFVAMIAYNIVAAFVIVSWVLLIGPSRIGLAFLILFTILYFVGFVYLTVIWKLASVVSVLEETYGFRAMTKSRMLIRGKFGVAIAIFLKLNVSFGVVQFVFQRLVVYGFPLGMVNRVSYATICFLLLSMLMLFGLVLETVIYFVCKSYHHENIDKSALSDHLEVYLLGEYVPLKSKDVQLEQYQV